MIRDEYLRLYDFLERTENGRTFEGSRRGGVVVSGQYGIGTFLSEVVEVERRLRLRHFLPLAGKTLFLFYCLIIRLTKGLPTIFTTNSRYRVFLLDAKGVHLIHQDSSIECSLTFHQPRTWALVEAGMDGTSPGPIITDNSFFLVHIAPPDERLFRGWKKELNGAVYFMDVWTWDEIWMA